MHDAQIVQSPVCLISCPCNVSHARQHHTQPAPAMHAHMQITIGLLQKAMALSGKNKVLIDGFPRNVDNRETFLKVVSVEVQRRREP